MNISNVLEFSKPQYPLAYLNQFIIWKMVPDPTRPKPKKEPCDYRTGHTHDAHDPAVWTDYATARQAAAHFGEAYSVGFVFTENDPHFFLDIDNCLLNGMWTDRALEICTKFKGCYVEISQSGTGLHVVGTGQVPDHSSKNIPLGLEFYTSGRYMALGHSGLGDPMFDASAVIAEIVNQYFPPKISEAGPGWHDGHELGWELPDDDELIREAYKTDSTKVHFGKQPAFRDLWEANVSVLGKFYPCVESDRPYDASSADMALAGKLAWITGNDCPRIERLMWKSGLARDKWEKHKTYLCGFTIPRALVKDGNFWDPKYREKKALAPPTGPGTIELQGIEASLLQLKTQDSVAQIFELKQAGKMLYDHSRGKWMEWDGKRWKVEITDKAFDFSRELARSLNWEGKTAMGTASFCGGVEKFARSSRTFAVQGDQFDRDHYLLNTPAGTIDLRTGKMRPHDPSDKITLCTAASPDSNVDGSAFRKFMSEITAGDEELIRFHQISLGACLSGAVEDHWMLFWTGTGRNGKNTLGDLVEALLGDYARTIPTSTLMSKRFESHPTEMANLQGVRLATSSELSDGDHWNDARIKQLTGDATLSARFIGRDFFEFERSFKLLVYGNYKPQLRSADEAFKARMKIVPFSVSFLGREDKDLPEKLRAEMGYVLQWLLDGHQQWLAAGKKLPKCAAVDAEISQYFESQSTPKLWVKECCEVLERDDRPNIQLHTVTECYRNYKQWKEARGEFAVNQMRWQPEALQGLETVKTQKGLVVKKLRLKPMVSGELWAPTAASTTVLGGNQ